MKKLSLIDSHCDTAFELYHRKQHIDKNTCHISLDRAKKYQNYAQFFAIWADKRHTDEQCYLDFIKISDNLKDEIKNNTDRIAFVTTAQDMTNAFACGKAAAFLAVEDARILANDIKRLDVLHSRGVKYLTLLWGGQTCIGASHDVLGGLTDFGRQVVCACFDRNILPDISHANEQVSDEVTDIAFEYGKPFIASHSNCYEQFSHSRNLRTRHLKAIISLKGLVGLNLCPYHVRDMSNGQACTVDDLLLHVERFMELGAEDVLGLGCDLDGTSLPEGFEGVDDLYIIADRLLQVGYSEETVDKIFYQNYLSFIERNL